MLRDDPGRTDHREGPRQGARPGIYVAIGLLGGLFFTLNALHYVADWIDDAYITYRYARNFGAGLGMAFNPGDRLEGLTDLGWALLLAPFANTDPLWLARALGIGFGWGTVALLGHWAWNERLPPGALAVALAPWVLLPWGPSWAMSGMEPCAVAFLVTLGWSRYRVEADDPRRWPLSALGLGLAPAFHPIGGIAPLVVLVWHILRPGRRLSRNAMLSAFIVLVLGAALVSVKLAWFGGIVPHTFEVKTGPWPWHKGAAYLRSFATAPSWTFAAVLAPALGYGLYNLARRRDAALPVSMALAGLLGAWAVNGDFFANYRMLVHVIPAMGAALALAVARLPRWPGLVAASITVLSILPLSSTKFIERSDATDHQIRLTPRRSMVLTPWRDPKWPDILGETWAFPTAWAIAHVPTGATVAFTDIGLFSYANDHRVIDLCGLVTPEMTLPRKYSRAWWADARAWLARDADYVIMDKDGGRYDALALEADPTFTIIDGCRTLRVFATSRAPPPIVDPAEQMRRGVEASRRVSHHVCLLAALARELAVDGNLDASRAVLEATSDTSPLSVQGAISQVACEVGVTCQPARPGCSGLGRADRLPITERSDP